MLHHPVVSLSESLKGVTCRARCQKTDVQGLDARRQNQYTLEKEDRPE